jgi:2-oxo-4-hydroxy-4-carboxy-5-ureidoimidazoline decarboxylase
VPADVVTLEALNRASREELEQVLAGVFEHSPWIAARAAAARPFASLEAVHAAMVAVVRRASPDEQLALLRAHPDLAVRTARAGALTSASAAEQSSAGLDRLDGDEYERFGRLNTAYREKFGFPFIIAVRRHDKQQILAAFEARLGNTQAQEVETALAQVFEIARLRLAGLITER